jgi:carboxyl-terminal processing protease
VTGESTQHRGVEPDVQLPSPIDMKEVGESALDSALPWDRIAGVPFQASAGTAAAPAVPMLVSEEDSRAQHDADYRWLVSDIAAIDTVRETKSVSLNLKARRDERTRQEKERLDRENSRRAAKNLPPFKTVEEIDKVKDDSPDIVLTQSAEIMGDIVTGARTQPAQKTARRS